MACAAGVCAARAGEAPFFVRWAQRFGSPHYTRRNFSTDNATGLLLAIGLAALVSFNPHRGTTFIFFTLVVTQMFFFNALFHLGATIVYAAWSPGLITSLTVFPITFVYLSRLAFAENLLTDRSFMASLLLAGIAHVVVVVQTVYRVGPESVEVVEAPGEHAMKASEAQAG
ncbi:MAG: HXXEE domain-containing protein [Verrucomicrobiota bacterium]